MADSARYRDSPEVRCPAGLLSIGLISQIGQIGRSSVMQIEGEDDLITLLAVFLAPLGSLIIYGQPNEGLVVVEVKESKKQQARQYLEQFTKYTTHTCKYSGITSSRLIRQPGYQLVPGQRGGYSKKSIKTL